MELHKQMNDIAFEALFNNATIGIVTVAATSGIILVNPYALFQFGYEDHELIGKPIEILIPDRFKDHRQKHDHYVSSPNSRSMGVGLDLFAKRKDGTEFPVEISLSHYRVNDQLFIIAFIIDVSVRKQNELKILQQQQEKGRIANELKSLNEQLEQKVEDRTMMLRETLHQLEKSRDELTAALEKEKELNDLKSRFVSMASHEFRTPLSTILSSVSLIEKYASDDDQEKRQKHINRIKSQVKILTNILEEFLSLGRLEEGTITERKVQFNVREMMTELVSEMTNLAKEGQHIEFSCTGSEMVFIDKGLLHNVLVNLVSNSIKYSGNSGRIVIAIHHTSDLLSITIQDNGMGISEEDLRHLTDRFFRGNNAINIQGTGLGLYIVRKYLDVMNGSISFTSKLNQGTKVFIAFNK